MQELVKERKGIEEGGKGGHLHQIQQQTQQGRKNESEQREEESWWRFDPRMKK